jgi:hypothetical protein
VLIALRTAWLRAWARMGALLVLSFCRHIIEPFR